MKPDEFEFLKLLYTYIGHCSRSQLYIKDRKENAGPLLRLRDKLFGKPRRMSSYSSLCSECFDILDSHLLPLTSSSEHLRKYHEKVEEIQSYCINENCSKALEKARKLLEEFSKNHEL